MTVHDLLIALWAALLGGVGWAFRQMSVRLTRLEQYSVMRGDMDRLESRFNSSLTDLRSDVKELSHKLDLVRDLMLRCLRNHHPGDGQQ